MVVSAFVLKSASARNVVFYINIVAMECFFEADVDTWRIQRTVDSSFTTKYDMIVCGEKFH